jgi:hypothetical protein
MAKLKRVLQPIRIMNNVEAIAFDKRYADYDYDPMTLIVGKHKLDVLDKLAVKIEVTVDGTDVKRELVLHGDLALYTAFEHGVLQEDVIRRNDYRIVILKG